MLRRGHALQMSLSEARQELDMFGQLQQFVSQQKLFLVYDGL